MLNFKKYANADAAVINLLKQLDINVNPQEIIDELEKHPDYPGLLALSDVLHWFKIDNAAYRVSVDEIIEVPTPFIAHTYLNDDFVLVNKIIAQSVVVTDQNRSNYKLSLTEFKSRFRGVVLTAVTPVQKDGSYIQSWPSRLSPFKIPAATLVLIVLLITMLVYHSTYFSSFNWQILLITIFKTAGLITSIFLLIQSIDKNNPLVQALCGGSSKTNCNAILTSKAAKVFEGLSWSEVGFFYFSGTWLSILFAGNNVAAIQLLALFNIISLPYTIYSINHQARVAKQWCVFCTVIQGLLWLEFTSLVMIFKQPLQFINIAQFVTLIICLFTPVAVWIIIKPLLLNNQQLKVVKSQLRKAKYNSQLFISALNEQPKYISPDEGWSILLGKKDAAINITMVSNPYCNPCGDAHKILDEWLNRLDDIQLRIVFTVNNHDQEFKTQTIKHLMALSQLEDKSIIKKALHDWYSQKQKNYVTWAKNYPIELESTLTVLKKQRDWCDMAEIAYTPTLLVNGHRLPETYLLQDIKYLLR